MNSVITNIYHKRNEYDISVITNTEQEYQQFQRKDIYIKYSKWSYDKADAWPVSCRYLNREDRGTGQVKLKSPINIKNNYIDQFMAHAIKKTEDIATDLDRGGLQGL